MPSLCVFGCRPAEGIPFHVFPNPKRCAEQLKLWIDIIGGKLESPSDYAAYKKKKVCDRHFTKSDHNRHNRLNALAVPSLHLHGCSSNVSSRTKPLLREINISLSAKSGQKSVGNNNSIVKLDSDQSPKTGLSKELELDKYVPPGPSDLVRTLDIVNMDLNECSIKNDHTNSEIDDSTELEPSADNTRKAADFPFEHNYCSRPDQPPKPRKMTRELAPSLMARKMSDMRLTIKSLRSEVSRLRRRVRTYKIKLANAKIKSDVGTPKRKTKVMTEKPKFTRKNIRLADTVLPLNRIVRIKKIYEKNTIQNKFSTMNPKIAVIQNEC